MLKSEFDKHRLYDFIDSNMPSEADMILSFIDKVISKDNKMLNDAKQYLITRNYIDAPDVNELKTALTEYLMQKPSALLVLVKHTYHQRETANFIQNIINKAIILNIAATVILGVSNMQFPAIFSGAGVLALLIASSISNSQMGKANNINSYMNDLARNKFVPND